MKLAQASALTFERPFNCDSKKDKGRSNGGGGGKRRPVSAYAAVKSRVDTNIRACKIK